MNYPEAIWCDTDLVGDDKPHDGWQKYGRLPKQPNDYGVNSGSMVRKEIHTVIRRYSQESNMTGQ